MAGMRGERGQAILEMAIFGSLILMVVGLFIGYAQQLNDRQYTQMEAFRRALAKACTYIPAEEDGAGASVQYSLMQDRHYVNLSGGFKQGSTQRAGASSSVYWSVPMIEKDVESQSLMVFHVNDDKIEINNDDYIPEGHRRYNDDGDLQPTYWTIETDGMSTTTDTNFNEENRKSETQEYVQNWKQSTLQETITTHIPYQIVEKSSYDDDYEVEKGSGTFKTFTQGVYRDTDTGQYRAGEGNVGNTVTRGRLWKTKF